MKIARLQESEFSELYGIHCSPITEIGDRDGIYSRFCRIPQGGHTDLAAHFEPEIFYIIDGLGLMTIENEVKEVRSGDVIRIPAFSDHQLKNLATDDLIFLSIYSEDFETQSLATTTVITSAPPTPDGPLHLGHISGPYLASNILNRYLRLRSVDVKNYCGTDDHQNFVHQKARTMGQSAEALRTQMRTRIQKDFARMRIDFDEFIEPKINKEYQNNVRNFVRRAIELNIIQLETVQFPYCVSCDQTLVDASIAGNCPDCGELSHGACEYCGIVVPPYDLNNSFCTHCKIPTSQINLDVYTFALHQYFHEIQDELLQRSLPNRVQELIQRVNRNKNLKVLLTHPDKNNFGIYLSEIDQSIHVWFEMTAHYEQFALSEQFWVNCFGFDNSFYYLIFMPSLLRAMHENAKIPDAIIINEFLLLEGNKFSTSRGHAIWTNDFSGHIDHLRLYLCLHRPAHQPEDFSIKNFEQFSSELEEKLQKLNQHAEIVAKSNNENVFSQILLNCNRAIRTMEYYLSPTTFDLRRASRELIFFIDFALQSANIGYSEKLILQTLATLMTPFMPQESERLFNSLKIKSGGWIRDWSAFYHCI